MENLRVVSYRNSTSNHNSTKPLRRSTLVVSYRNSTSNHNSVNGPLGQQGVVSYRNSTSNHNSSRTTLVLHMLYLIEILHQTTTLIVIRLARIVLYLIEILHQTTTNGEFTWSISSCILSKFYIKPQLARQWLLVPCVVSYRNSTSNHNL